ncbi:hypothetical protein [Spirosoma endbachense]|uniref:Uncharacterized protein n=1 Tax=Spirosoma endbachense TaxID=2666025 RepID=A0A6P1W1S1_9BACT|nr:hypothetical protein [Spirosoma endbachense]QHV97967.1 hypothetical protein GJR95_24455 [Spirosoma endbachense]
MATNERFVQLFTWWVTPSGKRQFAVVDKTGAWIDENRPGGVVSIYRTTQVKILETLTPNPVTYDLEDFWDLVDRQKLVEYIPGVTPIEITSTAQMTSPVI